MDRLAPLLLILAGCASTEYRSLLEYRVLERAERFATGPVGGGAETPHEAIALEKLLEDPQAAIALRDLLERAPLPGQLYALCGLYHADRRLFSSLAGKHAGSAARVTTQHGCIVRKQGSVLDVVPRILDGSTPRELQELARDERSATGDLSKKPLQTWIEELCGADDDDQARWTLSNRWNAAAAVPLLVRRLRSGGQPCHVIFEVLQDLGPWAGLATSALIEKLKDEDPKVQEGAARALASISPYLEGDPGAILTKIDDPGTGEEVRLPLIAAISRYSIHWTRRYLFHHADRESRLLAIHVTASAVDSEGEAVQSLITLLEEDGGDQELKDEALSSLMMCLDRGMLPPASKRAILRALARVLSRPGSRQVRLAAGEKLAEQGGLDGSGIAALCEVASMSDVIPTDLRRAREVMVQGGPEAVPCLLRLLRSEDVDVRFESARILGDLGTEFATTLQEAARDPDEDVRWHAEIELQRIAGL
jgi:hypothetical protein